MFDSQTIQMRGTTSTVLYSPWFPRGGDYGLFTLEVAAIESSEGTGTVTLTAVLLHKNASEAGDGDPAVNGTDGNIALSAVNRTTVDYKNGIGSSPTFEGFKELVRYQFTLTRSGSSTTGTSWATFRMLAPVWYDKV